MFRKRVLEPIRALLRQGVSPRSLALSLALGGVIGLFPIIGSTTVLCVVAAVLLRLNHVAIQAANYAVYPAQLLLLVPFMQAGQWLFGARPVPIGIEQLKASFAAGWWSALADLWQLTLFAIAAWAVLAIPVAVLIYVVSAPLLRRARWASAPTPTDGANDKTPR